MEQSFEFLMEMMSPDNVFIPKSLVARADICEEAKLIFSDLFTEYRFRTVNELKSAIREFDDDVIEAYSERYQKHSVKKIRSDLNRIADNLEEILAYRPTQRGELQ